MVEAMKYDEPCACVAFSGGVSSQTPSESPAFVGCAGESACGGGGPSRDISLGDDPVPSNFLGFRGLATLLPHFCQLSVREVGVCGVYPESP